LPWFFRGLHQVRSLHRLAALHGSSVHCVHVVAVAVAEDPITPALASDCWLAEVSVVAALLIIRWGDFAGLIPIIGILFLVFGQRPMILWRILVCLATFVVYFLIAW